MPPRTAARPASRPGAWLVVALAVLGCGDDGGARRTAPSDPEPAATGSAPAPAPPPDAEADAARDAWRDVLQRVIAGAGEPEPLEEFATTAQRQAMDKAKSLQQQLGLDPSDDETRLQLAKLYEQTMLPDRALQVIGGLLATQPEHIEGLYLAAHCLHVRQELDAALALLERVQTLAPRHLGARILAVSILRRLGRLDEACVVARAGLETSPFAAALKLPLALSAWEAGDLEVAERWLDEAAQDDAQLLEVRYLRGRLYRELGREDEARAEEAAHARLARLDDLGLPPNWTEERKRLALADSYADSGEWAAAELELRAILAQRAQPEAVALFVRALGELGRDVSAECAELAAAHPHLVGALPTE